MWPLILLTLVFAILVPVGWYRHRHGESPQALPTWQRTAEVFVDPASQRLMRVWVDPADASRHYVPDG